jgi:mono/diheme cytochrome c family protein
MSGRLHRIGSAAILVAAFAATSPVAADPAPAPDPDHGEILAKRWCAACHLVGADQKQATTDAPPFTALAKRPDFDAAKIAFFLLDPHPKMPNMALSRAEANDLAAYIATLSERRPDHPPSAPAPSRRRASALLPSLLTR